MDSDQKRTNRPEVPSVTTTHISKNVDLIEYADTCILRKTVEKTRKCKGAVKERTREGVDLDWRLDLSQ
jgi:hypothetical protein